MSKVDKNFVKGVNVNYDKMISSFTETAAKMKSTMPLAASSLLLTVEIIEVYKKAFNANVPKTK
jgi:hypothetical protein